MKKIYLTFQLSLLTLLIKAQFCTPVTSSAISASSTTACANGMITLTATGGTIPNGAYYNWRAYTTSGAPCSTVGSGIDFGQQGSPVNVVSGSQFQMPATGPATYYIRLTAVCSNGTRNCVSGEITVTRASAPTVATLTTQVAFCPGTSASIAVTSTAGATYSWTKDGAALAGQTTQTINFASPTATNAGVYKCLVTNACGTATSSAITFTPLGNQTISGAAITATSTTKAYSVVNQSASGVAYNWSLSGGGTITTATNTNSVSVDWGNTIDTYTLTLNKTLGACQITDTKTVSVVACTTNTANILINGINTNTVCEGNTVNLYPVSQGSTYAWSNGSSNFAITITPTANVTYSLAYTDNVGCALTGSLNVTVNLLPQFSISATSTKLCPNQTATLTVTNGINLASYDWGNNSMSDTNPYEVAHDGTSATYTLSANGYNGSLQCKTTETIVINAYLTPTVTALASNTTICNGGNTTLLAGGASSYTWNPSIPTNNVVSPTSTTTYSVIGENAGNCSGTNQITINVNACTGINELDNSVFVIYPNPAKNFVTVESTSILHYEIYNSIGEKVAIGTINEKQNQIDISNLSKGVYIIQLNDGKTKGVKRIIKE